MEVKLVSFLFDKLGTQPYSYFFHEKEIDWGIYFLSQRSPINLGEL